MYFGLERKIGKRKGFYLGKSFQPLVGTNLPKLQSGKIKQLFYLFGEGES